MSGWGEKNYSRWTSCPISQTFHSAMTIFESICRMWRLLRFCRLLRILSLENSLQTRKLSQIPSEQLFTPWFEIKRCKSSDASFKLSLRYRLYNAWSYGTFKWWQEKFLAFALEIISKLDSYILMTVRNNIFKKVNLDFFANFIGIF